MVLSGDSITDTADSKTAAQNSYKLIKTLLDMNSFEGQKD